MIKKNLHIIIALAVIATVASSYIFICANKNTSVAYPIHADVGLATREGTENQPLHTKPRTQKGSSSTPVVYESDPHTDVLANSKDAPWNADSIKIPALAGKTVYEAMLAYQASGGFTFTGREYVGLGFMLESINSKGPADGMYWFLYVNDTSAQKGASQTTLNAGDRVEWRYKDKE